MLTTSNPPIRVTARNGGRISDLFVGANQPVKTDQLLAVLVNPAHWQDVLKLETWLLTYGADQDSLPGSLVLGELQETWSAFSQHWHDYRYFITTRHTAASETLLRSQIEQLEKINVNLERQKAILNDEFALLTKDRNRQIQLLAQQLVSDAAAETTEAAWLRLKRQIESADATVLQNQMQMKQLRTQVSELQLTESDNTNAKGLILSEDLQRLRSAIAAWKQNYLITAPIAGNISLAKVWSAQQSVAAGEEILAVVPSVSGLVFGKANISGAGIGKINPGSRAVIRLDAYPAQQYGSIEGTVANIAALPQTDGYAINIALPASLKTSYGQTIPFRQEMHGKTVIITEERRVIERVFDRMSDLLKNR
jgi:HlyD family secretion protein